MSESDIRPILDEIAKSGLNAYGKFLAQVIASVEGSPPAGVCISVDWPVLLGELSSSRGMSVRCPS